MEADAICHKSNIVKQILLKTVSMLYFGYVLLRYILFYNLHVEVSITCNYFHLKFLQCD